MLIPRLFTGGTLIALLVGLAFADREWRSVAWLGASWDSPSWWLVSIAIAALGGAECGTLARGRRIAQWSGACAAISTVLIGACLEAGVRGGAGVIVGLALSALIGASWMSGSAESRAQCWRAAMIGALLVGVPLVCWSLLAGTQGSTVVVAALLVVKSSDIGAYFTGRLIGKRKLAPRLSPGKTWEGFAGGLAFAVLVGWLASQWSVVQPSHAIPSTTWLAWGFIAGIAGPSGDLVESALKRYANVKDSGRVLPGMGGVLDVVDSLTIAGPLALWILR